MDFGQIQNNFLEVLGVKVLKNKKYSQFFLLSPFFMSVTLPEQQNPRNLRALYTKRSRARVPIGGQCVLLQISPKIFFLLLLNCQNYCMNHMFLDILLNPCKKIVKKIESRPQGSKNAKKNDKNL